MGGRKSRSLTAVRQKRATGFGMTAFVVRRYPVKRGTNAGGGKLRPCEKRRQKAAHENIRERTARLERFDELVGEDTRFFGEIAGTNPIFAVDGFVSLRQEIADFFDEIMLRFIELLAFGDL